MKRSILSTILYRTQKPSQLLGAIIGSLLGFFLVIAAAQLFADFKSMVTSSEQAIGSQFLVVNKQVSVLNSFKLGKYQSSYPFKIKSEQTLAAIGRRLSPATIKFVLDNPVPKKVDVPGIGVELPQG